MNIQKQAEAYAKSIAKNETYQRYLADAFIAGAESVRSTLKFRKLGEGNANDLIRFADVATRKGDYFKVDVFGITFLGTNLRKGDVVMAKTDNPSVSKVNDWVFIANSPWFKL